MDDLSVCSGPFPGLGVRLTSLEYPRSSFFKKSCVFPLLRSSEQSPTPQEISEIIANGSEMALVQC